ncbi:MULTISPECIES: bifunctional heptose 7-phosphate kinase/heptose 1-phosphate adenyltransferase [Halobacteriovorax]|uniref:D-glycero-beta-D-manno-heptose-7-phosphate kinase n=1 Tax=Halobacteriovorax vibrionivorans TaxID=2152716 RepID=A0ABY0IE05_9BACT|nr:MULTISPECIES: PfkB family carbohydrate kinase [Halobacteriovorax]AYF44282.1 putative bifunctional protein RfaE, domain I [Halobacteriovorax sp. BALOs_7]RZF21191.1 D-glycero-beta-D-manno-heptose-7-phosphate kinase [Halobacteriovorax vibrionivorans]TGD45661.1 D-glycero-beta-D-manno-heptose-7-phosphate kinase [Halobacteriovorax sp. Y22]
MTKLISPQRFDAIVSNLSNIKPILVVGDVGIDKYTSGVVNRISPEAPVPLVEVQKEWQKLGLSANVSENLKTLGVESTLCGVMGDDLNANVLEDLLEEAGLSTWGVVRCEERPTVFKERIVTDHQQICRIDYESKKPISEDVEKRLIGRINELKENHGALILEDYSKGVLTESLISRLVNEFKESKSLIAVDPSRTTPPLFYKGVSLLKPNHVEAKLMVNQLGYSQDMQVEEIADILVDKLQLEKIIITLGARGMAMLDTKGDGKLHMIPTVANEVYDVSGAGDTTISLLVACLEAGGSLEEAAWVANCGAGVVVGKVGTATVSQDELRNYYEVLKEKMK